MLMNAWLDSLFEASNSFINSLNNNEVIINQWELPQVDGTDYMFNVSTERFGGGVFLDGLDSHGQNQEITLRSNNMFAGTNNVQGVPLKLRLFRVLFISPKINNEIG